MSELTDFRQAKDHFMLHDPSSPLTEDQRQRGSGLSYFEESADLMLVLEPKLSQSAEPVEVQISTGEVDTFLRWATVSFDVDGGPAELTIFRDGEDGDLFLPFADATSGTATYGAGRYLDVERRPDGKIVVDFNYAYNPYCAYNDSWSCPLTPSENRIKVGIRAGERIYRKP